MSNENIVYANELTVRFEQDENGTVSWSVKPDAAVDQTSHASFDELAQAGAPLSALATRALWELLYQEIIAVALDRGNMYLWKDCYRQLQNQTQVDSRTIEGELVSDAAEAIVIH